MASAFEWKARSGAPRRQIPAWCLRLATDFRLSFGSRIKLSWLGSGRSGIDFYGARAAERRAADTAARSQTD